MCGEQPRRRLILSVLVTCLGIPTGALEAQAIIAPSGRTLFNRASLVRSFARIDRSSLETGGASTDSTQYGIPLALVYGFHPKWSFIVAQPFVNADIVTRTIDGSHRSSLNGLADLQALVQYDGLYNHNTPGGLTRLSGVFGVQAPSGASRLSTGAFEYTTGLIFEEAIRLKYVFTSDIEYTFATENSRGVAMGDTARFDAVPAYFVIAREQAPPDASWMRRAYGRAFRDGAYLNTRIQWHLAGPYAGWRE